MAMVLTAPGSSGILVLALMRRNPSPNPPTKEIEIKEIDVGIKKKQQQELIYLKKEECCPKQCNNTIGMCMQEREIKYRKWGETD